MRCASLSGFFCSAAGPGISDLLKPDGPDLASGVRLCSTQLLPTTACTAKVRPVD